MKWEHWLEMGGPAFQILYEILVFNGSSEKLIFNLNTFLDTWCNTFLT